MSLNMDSWEYRDWENLTLILLENGATEAELIVEVKNLYGQIKNSSYKKELKPNKE